MTDRALTDEQVAQARAAVRAGGSVRSWARKLGVSRSTLYRALAGIMSYRDVTQEPPLTPDELDRGPLRGADHPRSKLTPRQVEAIRSHPPEAGLGLRLAERYGVAPSTISRIRRRKAWLRPT